MIHFGKESLITGPARLGRSLRINPVALTHD